MTQYKKDSTVVESLTAEQYRVTQESGTEASGSGEHLRAPLSIDDWHLCAQDAR